MNVEERQKQLRAEGFARTYVWEDGPNVHYPDHTHDTLSAHIILEGEMTITIEGRAHSYTPGERFDVTPETVHSARMGLRGCRYLIGEK